MQETAGNCSLFSVFAASFFAVLIFLSRSLSTQDNIRPVIRKATVVNAMVITA